VTRSARIRRVIDWHEHPRLIAWATTPSGRLVVWVAAAVLLQTRSRMTALLVLPLLALALMFPARRIELLALGALGAAYRLLPAGARSSPLFKLTGVMLMLAVVVLVFRAARDFQKLPPWAQRHPFVLLHAALYGTLGLSFLFPIAPGTLLGAFLTTYRAVTPFLLWRCSYMLLAGKRGSAARSRFRDHLFYCFPIWGGTITPFGKGYDYLNQTRADAPETIAATQLSGLKLLGLACLWSGFRSVFYAVAIGAGSPRVAALLGGWNFGIPTLADAIANAGARPTPAGTLWACLGIELIGSTLHWTIYGHTAIGILRLFGFRAFRNTYKPLLAPTLIDFWNRYYYYFKELLVEFFFFPTYVKLSRFSPRLRIFAATMAAAGAGNLYFHFLRDSHEIFAMPPAEGVSRVLSRAFYSLLLGLGISASMLRQRARRGRSSPDGRFAGFRRLRAIAGVWLFFSLLHIWGVAPVEFGFGQRTKFFWSLFGV